MQIYFHSRLCSYLSRVPILVEGTVHNVLLVTNSLYTELVQTLHIGVYFHLNQTETKVQCDVKKLNATKNLFPSTHAATLTARPAPYRQLDQIFSQTNCSSSSNSTIPKQPHAGGAMILQPYLVLFHSHYTYINHRRHTQLKPSRGVDS